MKPCQAAIPDNLECKYLLDGIIDKKEHTEYIKYIYGCKLIGSAFLIADEPCSIWDADNCLWIKEYERKERDKQ